MPDSGVPKLVLGNKCDLPHTADQRVDLEVSAKTGQNVKAAFDLLIRQVLDARAPQDMAPLRVRLHEPHSKPWCNAERTVAAD